MGLAKNQMEKAGMRPTNEFKDQGSYVNQIFSKSGDYEAGCFRNAQIASADGLSRVPTPDQPGNVTFYSNAKVDEALDGIRATTDPEPSRPTCSRRCRSRRRRTCRSLRSCTTSSATSTPTR